MFFILLRFPLFIYLSKGSKLQLLSPFFFKLTESEYFTAGGEYFFLFYFSTNKVLKTYYIFLGLFL
jgi:hypothetical protein